MDLKYGMVSSNCPFFIKTHVNRINNECYFADHTKKVVKSGMMLHNKLNGRGVLIKYMDGVQIQVGTFKADKLVKLEHEMRSCGDFYYIGGNFYACKVQTGKLKLEVIYGKLVFYSTYEGELNGDPVKHSELFS